MPLKVDPNDNDKFSQWYHLITLLHDNKVYSLLKVHVLNAAMIYIIMLLVELLFA